MTTLPNPSKILFAGWGEDEFGVCWYRTVLPAREMGAEYVIFNMNGCGVARKGSNKTHDIIVLQHCWERWQVIRARNMQKMGAKLIVNVDDWIPSVGKLGDQHDQSQYFAKKSVVTEWRTLIREADGVIASTPWLVEKVRQINPNVELARNGLDLGRYERHRRTGAGSQGPVRVLGWAGGTGHRGAFQRIAGAVSAALREHPELRLHLVGDDLTYQIDTDVADRVHHFAWSDFHSYPRHLATFDINLAPALETDFYKAKSQLRFYEACAMGTPSVVHPMYDEAWDAFKRSAMVSRTPREWQRDLNILIDDEEWLDEMRDRASDYAQSISIEARIEEWKSALTKLTSK